MRRALWIAGGLVLLSVALWAQQVGMDGRMWTASRLWDGVSYYKALVAGDAVDVTPTSPTANDYLPVRLTDGSSFYVAGGGGGGGGDGKILDGTASGQADVVGSAPAGTEQGLVVRNIPSGTQPISGNVGQSGSWTVAATGPLTDTQLRASAVPVGAAQSGVWTVQPGNTANTTPWLVAAAGGTLLLDSTFTGRIPTNGQKLMATSIPVVLPSDQSILPASEPGKWTCALDNIGATLTQCQAAPAAGQRLWLTSVVAISTTATAATFAIRQGTGTNCATSTTGLIPGATVARTMVLPANTTAPFMLSAPTGIGAVAANAICVIGVATNTLNISIAGYTTP